MIVKSSGESLALVLAHFGHTRRDLAQACGYSTEFLSRVLHNRVPLTTAARVKLAKGVKNLIRPDNIL